MSLMDEIDSVSRGLVKRETITLPRAQKQVQVRGLMTEEQLRINAEKDETRRMLMAIALCAEDPASGRPVWNVANVLHLEAIGRLHPDDAGAIATASGALNGEAPTDELLGKSEAKGSSSTSSAPDSDERPAISAVA
jgi:hypothetical protein